MAIMILVVTIFFVMVGLFVLMTSLSGLKQKAAVLQADNARLLVSKIANSPEFSCGNSFGTGMGLCVDAAKLMGVEENIKKYGNGAFWGVQGLEVVNVYPPNKGVECTSANFPNCDTITLVPNNNGTGVSNFVSLCWKASDSGVLYDKCTLADVIVTYNG